MQKREREKRGRKPKRKKVAWSPAFAYAVGLMTTDGNLSPDGRHLTFTSQDKSQIVTIMRCFDLKRLTIGKTLSGKRRNGWAHRVQWGDVVLYRFFLSIGLTQNKSRTIGELDIPEKYFFDFLRGHHDGDGSFYSYYDPRWEKSFMFYLSFTSASKTHIVWLQSTVKRLLKISGHLTHSKGRNFHQLKYAKKESLKLLKKMYSNKSLPSLYRKRLKIEKALRIVGKSL